MFSRIKNIVNTEDKKRLLSNFLSLSLLQAFTYILPLLTLPYLVRVLGADKFGLVMFAQSFIMFFSILVDYGFNLSATREIAIHRDNKEKITEIFSSVMQIKFILIVVSFIILSIIVFTFEKFSNDWKLYYLTFLFVIGQAFFPIWYFQGMERMKYITIVNVFSKLLFTIFIFVFIRNKNDYILVPVLNSLGFILGGIISLWMIYKYFNLTFKIQSFQTMMVYFKDSSQFFLSRVSLSIYTSANTFVLGLFTNTTLVGYYSIAEKLYQAMSGIYHPIINTIYPYLSKTKNIFFYNKLFIIISIINTIGVIFIYLFSNDIIDIIFKIKSMEVNTVLLIFVTSSILHVPAILLGYPLLAAFGYPKYANLTVIQSSIIHLIGLGILTILKMITIYNVAYMVLITETTVFLTRIYYAKKFNLIFKRSK
ncbi:oligosaccharide flippase family protein [Nitratifractor salsuginis]|uniref:Polysaccharide biosynthesis protein n=1 Tax=Nitratifractor salsuginis (strain DSM 16511 / JCM 12458 / E9I37-1) TaxID=749222 RepID=E6WZL9_NITSE|nr:oligosaccharide flippase family protein [Nitratifractor salsuginis]ADV46660.1 polysaccharide biosynthesis protein [Nitratifractor salsuginis DSM 16511]